MGSHLYKAILPIILCVTLSPVDKLIQFNSIDGGSEIYSLDNDKDALHMYI